MKVTVISSSELKAGNPLNADYYVNREPEETYGHFTRRRKREDLERRARYHERQAVLRRQEASDVSE